jgi:Fe2+ transport system protein B
MLNVPSRPATETAARTVLVIGKENVGKSALVSALTGRAATLANFSGSTVSVERYEANGWTFLDTPGILRRSDTATTRAALERLEREGVVLLVAQATHLDDDLADLLPLLKGKRGAIAVTFWDKVNAHPAATEPLRRLQAETGVPLIAVDARRPTEERRRDLLAALAEPLPFAGSPPKTLVGWRIEPRPGWLEHRWAGPVLALLLLLLPAVLAVVVANQAAGWIDLVVAGACRPLADSLQGLPEPWAEVLAGRYGLVTMGPLLLVWAAPTVLLYAFLLGAYKASGLIERLNVALHPLARPFGLSGRDVVWVLMGFGCNVPAVISTRACSDCSRGTAIAAIAFGAACSYQFPATLAVFTASGQPWLVVPFLAYLGLTTLVYLRLTAPREARSPLNVLVVQGRAFVEWPRWSALWGEGRGILAQFFFQALPVFFAMTLVASLLAWLGILDGAARWLGPVMGLFHLPSEAALPVVLASIRKDGILLFLREGAGGSELVAPMTPVQVLTAVYLAGVLLPCLVTALTIAREKSWGFVCGLLARQALAAVFFAALLGWIGAGFGGWRAGE